MGLRYTAHHDPHHKVMLELLQLGNFQLAIRQVSSGVIYNDNRQLFPWMAPEVLAGRIPTMVSMINAGVVFLCFCYNHPNLSI